MNTIENIKGFAKASPVPATKLHTDAGSGEVWDMVTLLNLHLGHAAELRARTKQAYWNAKGANFYTVHKMFDDFSDELDSIADDIASRIMALGGIPAWVPPYAGKAPEFPPYPYKSSDAVQHFEALIGSYQWAGSKLPATVAKAASLDDFATAAVVTGFVKLIDEQMGVIAAHLPPQWTAKPASKAAR
jgi:starvation-inducible DNA-binding protein